MSIYLGLNVADLLPDESKVGEITRRGITVPNHGLIGAAYHFPYLDEFAIYLVMLPEVDGLSTEPIFNKVAGIFTPISVISESIHKRRDTSDRRIPGLIEERINLTVNKDRLNPDHKLLDVKHEVMWGLAVWGVPAQFEMLKLGEHWTKYRFV